MVAPYVCNSKFRAETRSRPQGNSTTLTCNSYSMAHEHLVTVSPTVTSIFPTETSYTPPAHLSFTDYQRQTATPRSFHMRSYPPRLVDQHHGGLGRSTSHINTDATNVVGDFNQRKNTIKKKKKIYTSLGPKCLLACLIYLLTGLLRSQRTAAYALWTRIGGIMIANIYSCPKKNNW